MYETIKDESHLKNIILLIMPKISNTVLTGIEWMRNKKIYSLIIIYKMTAHNVMFCQLQFLITSTIFS